MFGKVSPAGRLEVINLLLKPEITDDEGNVVGYAEPMITQEEAFELLRIKDARTRFSKERKNKNEQG